MGLRRTGPKRGGIGVGSLSGSGLECWKGDSMDGSGLACFGMDWPGLVQAGLDRSQLVFAGQDWIGLQGTCFVDSALYGRPWVSMECYGR